MAAQGEIKLQRSRISDGQRLWAASISKKAQQTQ